MPMLRNLVNQLGYVEDAFAKARELGELQEHASFATSGQ